MELKNLESQLKTGREASEPSWQKANYALVMRTRCKRAVDLAGGKIVLDLGCGTGWCTYELSKVAKWVVGIDRSKACIQYARLRYQRPNINFRHADALKYDFKKSNFELVVLCETLEHFTKQESHRLMQQVRTATQENGLVYGSTPLPPARLIPALIRQNKSHKHLYNRTELMELLETYFSKVRVDYIMPDRSFPDCQYFTCRNEIKLPPGSVKTNLITSRVEIRNLRTFRWHKHKDQYLHKSFFIFDAPVEKTPHFQLIADYQANPHLDVQDTEFCRLTDFALSLHRQTSKKPYLHNRKLVIDSGKERCVQILQLYNEIKSTGRIDSIEVVANHDGTYTITDGLHRASIAHALGLKTIPVKIWFVDRQLSGLMQILRNHYRRGQKVLYIPIEHPVFSDWKVLRDGRWPLIEREFGWKGKSVLDLGCYTGYFSHKAAKLGADVTGIDQNQKLLDIARRVNKLIGLEVNFIYASIDRYLDGKKFDCILFLSLLHWILRGRGIAAMKETLTRISSSSPVMFFDTGQDNEPKMRSQEWTHGLETSRETIPKLVISNSKYRHFKHLGTGQGGRDVFKFTI